MTLFPFIVTFTGFVLPLASPAQFRKTQPLAGVAVALTTELLRYEPPGGFSETDPAPLVDVVSVYDGSGWKLPVITLFPFIVTFSGLAFPLASPVHPEKYQPESGVAVTVTTEP